MRNLTKVVLAMLLVAATSLAALADARSVSYSASTFSEAQAAGKKLVVDVYADWCPTCQAQKPILEEIRKDAAMTDVLFVSVNFDREKEFLRQHKIAYQSTILIFKGKEELARSIAVTDRDRLRSMVLTAVRD